MTEFSSSSKSAVAAVPAAPPGGTSRLAAFPAAAAGACAASCGSEAQHQASSGGLSSLRISGVAPASVSADSVALPQVYSEQGDLLAVGCHDSKVTYGHHSASGHRTYNEDRVYASTDLGAACAPQTGQPTMFFAVYDGHNGEAAVDFVRENLHINVCREPHYMTHDICGALKWGFAETEAALQRLVLEQIGGSGFTDTETSLFSSGTTACVALLQHNTLYVASLGDSRCIISRAGRAVPLTEDHHLRTNRKEQARVRAAGGSYDDEGYLNGVLAVSRAFGGFSKQTGEKLMGLSSEPDVNVHHIRKEDEFLLLACDGIFDVLTSQECVSLVRSKLRAGDSPFTASQQLAELAMQRYSLDNLSVVVVVLQSPNKEPDREREGWWGEEGDSEEQYVIPRHPTSSSGSCCVGGAAQQQQQQQQQQQKPDRPKFDFSVLKGLL
ncbi:probable protein phosphatase 2C 56 [Cyclospora cayetanensis]|uniref:Probable protein phosphatase 2C 56 n=1 Tax=Cyclospora cayetanensis TaxID=88456 RepID=A0A6P6S3P6_9EIME|nr:probable protein phosphatase 2C 56 [Cyclospora cayetanensis]